MAAITTPLATQPPQLRPLNILRDLPGVADLVEQCFADTIDAEGRRYLQQMRRAGTDNTFMRWASNAVDSVSMPLSGYVWEENGEIIGNVSLIPYRQRRKKIYLIANVAVRPDFRRRGIGRALTEVAMQHSAQRHGSATWLHVREDNPGAIALYAGLGFQELARRTTWQARPEKNATATGLEVRIGKRSARDWPLQAAWLDQLYPDLMSWYQSMPWRSLRPGLFPTLYRFMLDHDVRHWTIHQDGILLAAMTWQAMTDNTDRIWAAVPASGAESGMTALLLQARRSLPWRQNLTLDFPAGLYAAAIESAGFHASRTLLWMKLRDENSVSQS